jgi:cupin 2 domain-containing protein
MEKHNLFQAIPEQLPQELFDTLLQRDGLRLERIISQGHATPPGKWYDQDQDEWVILLSGSATLLFENGETQQLTAGDYLLIPAHCRHRVQNTDNLEPSIWLALHLKSER